MQLSLDHGICHIRRPGVPNRSEGGAMRLVWFLPVSGIGFRVDAHNHLENEYNFEIMTHFRTSFFGGTSSAERHRTYYVANVTIVRQRVGRRPSEGVREKEVERRVFPSCGPRPPDVLDVGGRKPTND